MWEGEHSLAVEWAGDLSLSVTSGWFLFHRLSFFLCAMGIRKPTSQLCRSSGSPERRALRGMLGEPRCPGGTVRTVRTVYRQWSASVCMASSKTPRKEQTARCTGREGPSYSLFHSFSNDLLNTAGDTATNQTNGDPSSKGPRGTQTLIIHSKERYWLL